MELSYECMFCFVSQQLSRYRSFHPLLLSVIIDTSYSKLRCIQVDMNMHDIKRLHAFCYWVLTISDIIFGQGPCMYRKAKLYIL